MKACLKIRGALVNALSLFWLISSSIIIILSKKHTYSCIYIYVCVYIYIYIYVHSGNQTQLAGKSTNKKKSHDTFHSQVTSHSQVWLPHTKNEAWTSQIWRIYTLWWTVTFCELERSTMLFSWENPLFRLGHVQVRKRLVHQRVYFHFPMVFLWFSYGFPMVFPWFSVKYIPNFQLHDPIFSHHRHWDHDHLLRASQQMPAESPNLASKMEENTFGSI